MTKFSTIFFILCLALSSQALSACGKRGDLYLPPQNSGQ